MEYLLDFYPDPDGSGRKWEPVDFSTDLDENLVFLRSNFHGHVSNIVCPLVNNEPDFRRAKRFREKTEAYSYLCNKTGGRPTEFVNSTVRSIMAKYQKP